LAERRESQRPNDNKAAQRQLKKLNRHNRHRIYLAPYKRKQSQRERKRQRDAKNAKGCKIPTYITATTGKLYAFRISKVFSCILSYQQGVYIKNESGIVNLDNAEGPDTHWIVYAKRVNHAIYFDSFDNFQLPRKLKY